jgi:hypothetical protein
VNERPDPFELFATDAGDARPPASSVVADGDALDLFVSERTTSEDDAVRSAFVHDRPAPEPVRPPELMLTVPGRDVEVTVAPRAAAGWVPALPRSRSRLVLAAAVIGLTAFAVSTWRNGDVPGVPGLEPTSSDRSIASRPQPTPVARGRIVQGGQDVQARAQVAPPPFTQLAPEPQSQSRAADLTRRANPAGARTSIPPAPAIAGVGRQAAPDVPASAPTRMEPTSGLRLAASSDLTGLTSPVAPALSAPAGVPAPSGALESRAAETRPGEADRPPSAPEVDPNVRARQAIAFTVDRYRAALTQLDSQMARSVWPSVDAGALDRAFSQLQRQRVDFDHCEISHGGGQATAFCSGRAEYVPRVGNNSPRTDYRTWSISLRQSGDRWLIQQVASQ